MKYLARAKLWNRPLWQHRLDLTFGLVQRDLKLRYRGSLLGVAWGLVTPLAQLLVFLLVFRGVVKVQIPHYASYVFSGVLAWNWFQTSLSSAVTSLMDGRGLLRRPGFPAAVLPAATVIGNFVHYLLALPILMGLLVMDGVGLQPSLALLPLVLFVQFAMTVGLALLVALGQVVFRDTQQLLGIVLMLTFYLTPVFYQTSAVPQRYRWVFDLNVLVQLMNAHRATILGSASAAAEALLPVALAALLVVVVALSVLATIRHRLAEEL